MGAMKYIRYEISGNLKFYCNTWRRTRYFNVKKFWPTTTLSVSNVKTNICLTSQELFQIMLKDKT